MDLQFIEVNENYSLIKIKFLNAKLPESSTEYPPFRKIPSKPVTGENWEGFQHLRDKVINVGYA